MKEIGIYIHIPFCKSKCYYCDFCSYANKEELVDKYIRSLICEIDKISELEEKEQYIISTIYIGGGTPSFIESKYIVKIIKKINEKFNIKKEAEITIEVNPGTVDYNKLEDYFNCGINRLSIGLQSTYDYLLKEIGRIHSFQEFIETYHMARQVGFVNINVDLMLALPNQTIEQIKDSVEEVIGLEPEHISVYSLILEENTILCKMVNNGELELLKDEEERKMYWKIKELLEENGYTHYEISNFSKPNYYSRHNVNCWEQMEYIGLGVAAHSYMNGIRYSNTENIEKYVEENNIEIEKVQEVEIEKYINSNYIIHEKQDKLSMEKEYIILGLRKIEGINIQSFKKKFVDNPIYLFYQELEKLCNEELIQIDGDFIKLTDKGLDFANIVWEEFI